MNFPKFSHLALELQQQVMEQCETDDLARLGICSIPAFSSHKPD
jgi:hypothetical protein